jgi:hypothetical protein
VKNKNARLSMMMIFTAILMIGGAMPKTSQAATITTDVDGNNERVTIECKKLTDGKRDLITQKLAEKYCEEHPEDDDCGPGGCDPGANAAGTSATGFVGINGTNPVPASPARTCRSGKLCANPGQANCSGLHPSWTCKHTYNYSTQACGCGCKP